MEENIHVYDKAKYHDDEVQKLGLPEEHACNHTVFFMTWLLQNDMMSDVFYTECKEQVNDLKQKRISIYQLYEWWDCCLTSDMLSDEGNNFAQVYFDFEKGSYLADYEKYLVKNQPSAFHVEYTPENEKLIHSVITKRYKDWKIGRPWWKFWK